jgi:hypothetical protein
VEREIQITPEVNFILDGKYSRQPRYAGIQYFAAQTGAIRIDANAGVIDIYGEMTPQQMRVLSTWFDKPVIDVNDPTTGRLIGHYEVESRGKIAPSVLNQINNHFTRGTNYQRAKCFTNQSLRAHRS